MLRCKKCSSTNSKDLELHKTRIRMVIEHCNARTDLWAAA